MGSDECNRMNTTIGHLQGQMNLNIELIREKEIIN